MEIQVGTYNDNVSSFLSTVNLNNDDDNDDDVPPLNKHDTNTNNVSHALTNDLHDFSRRLKTIIDVFQHINKDTFQIGDKLGYNVPKRMFVVYTKGWLQGLQRWYYRQDRKSIQRYLKLWETKLNIIEQEIIEYMRNLSLSSSRDLFKHIMNDIGDLHNVFMYIGYVMEKTYLNLLSV